METADETSSLRSDDDGLPDEENSLNIDTKNTACVNELVVLVKEKNMQTGTLMPSESTDGEFSYVDVVKEENKTTFKVNINRDVKLYSKKEPRLEQKIISEKSNIPKSKRKCRKKKYHTCPLCDYKNTRQYLLDRHIKRHSEERPFKCDLCKRAFKTLACLRNHLNMHSGVKPHVCKDCGKRFTTSGVLARHKRYKHVKEKPHKCTECEYATVEPSKLRLHVRCHTGERPYRCPKCTYASSDAFKLKRHLRTHTGEKPYKCDICKLSFAQVHILNTHKHIHNADFKPMHACELCPTKCSRGADLRVHIKNMHMTKNLQCKYCSMSFRDKYSCKVHNMKKCFECDLCQYATSVLSRFEKHMVKHTDEKHPLYEQTHQAFNQKRLMPKNQNPHQNSNCISEPLEECINSCFQCGQTFSKERNLLRHLKTHNTWSRNLEIRKSHPSFNLNDHTTVLNNVKKSLIIKSKTSLNTAFKKYSEIFGQNDGDDDGYVLLHVVHMDEQH